MGSAVLIKRDDVTRIWKPTWNSLKAVFLGGDRKWQNGTIRKLFEHCPSRIFLETQKIGNWKYPLVTSLTNLTSIWPRFDLGSDLSHRLFWAVQITFLLNQIPGSNWDQRETWTGELLFSTSFQTDCDRFWFVDPWPELLKIVLDFLKIKWILEFLYGSWKFLNLIVKIYPAV